MSKEFEEIVLKKLEKLDNIEREVKNNSQRLGRLETEVGSLGTEVGSLRTEVGSLKTIVGNLEMEVKDTKQDLQNLTIKVDERFNQVENRLGKLEIELNDTGEVVKYINQNFIKFDYDINKKIDTLFDAFTTNKEKSLVHEDEIASLNAKVFNQDIRISNLEEKVLTA